MHQYEATVFIDCSGDADAAAFMGCEYETGDVNGLTQMPVLCFNLYNVNDNNKIWEEIENSVRSILPEIIADTDFPLIDNDFFAV